MAKYIKSYSNYVLKSKHQDTSNGTIFERDITTIGGRDQFARNQVPIYRSGNFIITINGDNEKYKKTFSKPWYENESGKIWNNDILKNYEKDEKASFDEKLVIKKDYFDLRDYAYYGSCSELMRASITDILKKYPGEIFVPYRKEFEGINQFSEEREIQYDEDVAKSVFGDNYSTYLSGLYDTYTSFDIDTYSSTEIPYEYRLTEEEEKNVELGIPFTRRYGLLTDSTGKYAPLTSCTDTERTNPIAIDVVAMDNPFGINIHDRFVPKGANPLKYFAEGGIENYVAYKFHESEADYEKIEDKFYDGSWNLEDEYKIEIISSVFNGLDECGKSEKVFTVNNVGNCEDNTGSNSISLMLSASTKFEVSGGTTEYCLSPGKYIGYVELGFKKTNYDFSVSSGEHEDICEDDDCENGIKFTNEDVRETVIVESHSIDNFDEKLKIYLFVGQDKNIKYFVENFGTLNNEGIDNRNNFVWRIRPNKKIINNFFNNELDLFEKILLNRNSDPIYTSYFEIVDENKFGYYTYTKSFTFPTTYGGYNLGSSGPLYSQFVSEMSKISNFYDERFSDNLWRSMTHEAIKNFDWTDSKEKADGTNKIQKTIRLFGREFDEIKNYISAIKNNNNVTYDDVNNLPDYFYTDKLEDEGWDVFQIKPLILSEYINDLDGITADLDKLFCSTELYLINKDGEYEKCSLEEARKNNCFYTLKNEISKKYTIKRNFIGQFDDTYITPYSKDIITGIRVIKEEGEDTEYSFGFPDFSGNSCIIDGGINVDVTFKNGEKVANGYHNNCGNLIKIYSNENKYTPSDVNTEFMKRLIMNSRDLLSHKGTIDGMEMMLSLFGLKSKNFVFKNETYFKCKSVSGETTLELTSGDTWNNGERYYNINDLDKIYDYDIKEYSMFTTYIEDEYLPEKDMFRIDWINSKKLMTYNTDDFKNGIYIDYQGLPVSFENEYVVNEDNEMVVTGRKLYPHFESTAIYDGNPYYQMNGGWLQKRPFAFDLDNNIISEDNESNSRKNKALFTETVRNIYCVNNLQSLLTDVTVGGKQGDIIQVLDISGRYAIVDGIVYQLLSESDSQKGESFFYATVADNSVVIGKTLFTDYVIISNPYVDDKKQTINLNGGYYSNKKIKVYVLESYNETGDKIYSMDAYSSDASISTFTVFENGKYMSGDTYTNYFMLNNPDFRGELSMLGWQQLKEDEFEYYKLNAIENYYNGNNPHYGHMNYDNGHEYLTYFSQLFKHSINNNLLDYRQFKGSDYDILDEIVDEDGSIIRDSYRNIGFKNLIDTDETCNIDYDKYLRLDNKCHFFGSFIERQESPKFVEKNAICNPFKKRSLNDDTEINSDVASYNISDIIRKNYINSSSSNIKIEDLRYAKINEAIGEDGLENDDSFAEKVNGITDQIVNTKRMEIDFFIRGHKEYTKEWLEEVKYIDSIVMPYLTQMMPSNVICRVNYKTVV